jgi:microcystin-dependent protein
MDIIKLFGGGFPLTVERMQFLQETYGKAFIQISALAGGGRLIIGGAVLNNQENPTSATDGSLILNGEIIEFRSAAYNDRIAIFEEVVEVPYNEDLNSDGELDPKVSDVIRFATFASTGGEGSFNYSDLKRIESLEDLSHKAGDLKQSFSGDLGSNWIALNGAILNITAAPQLFSIFGTTFGGDGVNTFTLPDARNRVLVGAGVDYALKAIGGEKEVTLTAAQMPIHSHSGNIGTAGNHRHGFNNDQAGGDSGAGYIVAGDSNRNQSLSNAFTKYEGDHSHTLSINNAGNGAAHNNMIPFLAVNTYIFKGL